jgi:hypothetical protein
MVFVDWLKKKLSKLLLGQNAISITLYHTNKHIYNQIRKVID